MAARKPARKPVLLEPAPPPEPGEVVAPLTALDPIDGRPVFADGLSRRRWLAEHADERKAARLAELLDADGLGPFDPGESDPGGPS